MNSAFKKQILEISKMPIWECLQGPQLELTCPAVVGCLGLLLCQVWPQLLVEGILMKGVFLVAQW